MTTDATPPAHAYHDDELIASAYLAATGAAFQGHAGLWGISIALTAAGGSVDVYDGIDANGKLLLSHRDAAAIGHPREFAPKKAVRIERGIWVVIANALVTVVFEPHAYFRKSLE